MTQSPTHPASVRNNIIRQNVLFAKLQAQYTSYIQSGENDIDYFGKFDSNYYARPIDDRITINNTYPGVIANFDLEIQKKKTQIFQFKKENDKLLCGQEFDGITNWNKNFVYLGFEFDGNSVLLKSASISRLFFETFL